MALCIILFIKQICNKSVSYTHLDVYKRQIRKSIYEYYVGKRYILKNQRKASNIFEKRTKANTDDFKLLQLDMIISSIEARWVDNA